jgi:Sulfatase
MRDPSAPAPPGPRAATRTLHLAVLYALAVSQPLLGVLGRNGEFFAARQSTAGDIVIFALLVCLAPPLLAGACEALVDRVSRRGGWILHLALVGLLVALVVAQAIKRTTAWSSTPAIAASLLFGLAGVALYLRSSALRSVTTWFAPLPLLVLALFLFGTPVRELVFSSTPAAASVGADRTPVVMIVFDEFTGTSLLDAHNQIDPVLFPNFARLVANGGVYYRNYTAAADETTRVVSALLTGDMWQEHALPIAANYPHNLFTLLGGADRLVVNEEASDLCPPNLCDEANERGSRRSRQRSLLADAGLVYLHRISAPDLEARLTPVDQTLGQFTDDDGPHDPRQAHNADRVLEELGSGGRPARFAQWLARIDGGDQTVYFEHVLLPHVPWQYLPDGRRYRSHSAEYIPGVDGPNSFGDRWLLTQAYQRHLLQAGFVDRMVGKLIARLKQTGLYDRALVVLTADNGESFLHVGHDRHIADTVTFTDVADTPLLIKFPRHEPGGYDDRHVRTIDVLPTIADAVGAAIPWRISGRSILRRGSDGPVVVNREQLKKGDAFSISLTAYDRARRAALRRKVALFGSDGQPPGLWGVGPNHDLIGEPLTSLRLTAAPHAAGSVNAEIRGLLAKVQLSSDFLPANITGVVSGVGLRRGLPVALALNGRVAAVGRTAMLDGDAHLYFTFMAAPRFFREGANRARVFLVTGRGRNRRLEQVAAT